MTGFFRRFIKGYAKIARPLNDLLEGEASKLKSEELELTPEALQAFEDLKKKCMTALVLVFTDFRRPFRLETDVFGEGLGTVLLQESDDGHYHPVAFASQELNARMCGLKQGMNKPIKSYYERMADISVKLEQYHGDRFGPGELKMMKDCFYAGLKEHNKYLVSHMKDCEQYGPAQMLKKIREQEDSRYLANTSPKPHHTDSGNKNTSHYNKNSSYDKPRAYTVRHTDVQIPDREGDKPDPSLTNEIDPDEIYNEGYYVAVINTANEADKWGRCFNCGKEGHQWAECKEPLKESLKLAKERANRKKQALNRNGGVGTKGAQPPQMGMAKANTAKAEN